MVHRGKTCWPLLVAIALLAQSCEPRGESVTVFAAASLTDAFRTLAAEFEAARPGTTVRLNFAGSQTLRTQIEFGAPADVFASAAPTDMALLNDAGIAVEPVELCRNELVLAVASTSKLWSIDDLGPEHKLISGTPSSPVGAYTSSLLDQMDTQGARLASSIVSREPNARLVLSKVALGEADAAFVYRTDAAARDDVRVLDLPVSAQPAIRYQVARLTPAGDAFTRYAVGADGQATLRGLGFLSP